MLDWDWSSATPTLQSGKIFPMKEQTLPIQRGYKSNQINADSNSTRKKRKPIITSQLKPKEEYVIRMLPTLNGKVCLSPAQVHRRLSVHYRGLQHILGWSKNGSNVVKGTRNERISSNHLLRVIGEIIWLLTLIC